jgi:hypothetical protein
MLTARLPCVAGFALLLATAPAVSQAPQDDHARLELLYRLSVAVDSCDNVDLTEADEDKLDKAITALEGQLSLSEQAAQDWYTQLSATADTDKESFCKETVPLLRPTVEKLPD